MLNFGENSNYLDHFILFVNLIYYFRCLVVIRRNLGDFWSKVYIY